MSVKHKAANVDSRRRVVLPESFPANSPVTFQKVDEDTWIVKRHRPRKGFVLVAIEQIEKLPDDPDWEAFERRVAEHTSKRVPRFQE